MTPQSSDHQQLATYKYHNQVHLHINVLNVQQQFRNRQRSERGWKMIMKSFITATRNLNINVRKHLDQLVIQDKSQCNAITTVLLMIKQRQQVKRSFGKQRKASKSRFSAKFLSRSETHLLLYVCLNFALDRHKFTEKIREMQSKQSLSICTDYFSNPKHTQLMQIKINHHITIF